MFDLIDNLRKFLKKESKKLISGTKQYALIQKSIQLVSETLERIDKADVVQPSDAEIAAEERLIAGDKLRRELSKLEENQWKPPLLQNRPYSSQTTINSGPQQKSSLGKNKPQKAKASAAAQKIPSKKLSGPLHVELSRKNTLRGIKVDEPRTPKVF